MDISATKLAIIRIISDLQNETFLRWLLQFLSSKEQHTTPTLDSSPNKQTQAELQQIARQPIPESIDLEQLKKEQNYSHQKLVAHWENFDHTLFVDDPPLEVLLQSLSSLTKIS